MTNEFYHYLLAMMHFTELYTSKDVHYCLFVFLSSIWLRMVIALEIISYKRMVVNGFIIRILNDF